MMQNLFQNFNDGVLNQRPKGLKTAYFKLIKLRQGQLFYCPREQTIKACLDDYYTLLKQQPNALAQITFKGLQTLPSDKHQVSEAQAQQTQREHAALPMVWNHAKLYNGHANCIAKWGYTYRVLVAVNQDGHIIGTISFDIFVAKRKLAVDALGVESHYQGQGIGHALLTQAFIIGHLYGVETVTLESTEPALGFYFKRGFRRADCQKACALDVDTQLALHKACDSNELTLSLTMPVLQQMMSMQALSEMARLTCLVKLQEIAGLKPEQHSSSSAQNRL